MAKVINMPKMGEAMEEGQIVSWMYEEGQTVEKGEPLFEIMTDKSTMEFPCPESGTLLKILVECNEDYDCGTHMLYIALVTEARKLSAAPSMTYAYYFANVKPKPAPAREAEKPRRGFVCRICGYFYEGDELPPDFICPLCKHGAADFEPVGF